MYWEVNCAATEDVFSRKKDNQKTERTKNLWKFGPSDLSLQSEYQLDDTRPQ